MASNALPAARAQAVARLKTLTNQELKEICRTEHLAVSGVKAQLQGRIIELIDRAIDGSSMTVFERVRAKIHNKGTAPPPQYQNTGYNSSASPTAPFSQHRPSHITGTPQGGVPGSGYPRPNLPVPGQRVPGRMVFKSSPFYHIQEALTPVQDLTEMPQNRHQVNYSLVLSESVSHRLREDSSLKVMMYCTSSSILGQYELCDIAFPSQMDVRVNSDEVRHNFKGLKNKPGTTKPADLTPYLRKNIPRFHNQMQINYALTSKRYSWIVNLVKKASAEELTERVRTNRVISKDSVVREMISKAKDPDIIATSSVMSLKDPISTMRIDLPCRSTLCRHNQCFDVSSFIQLQEQAPTWACPICNKTISYEALAIDQYVMDILQKTSKSVEQVTVEPEGAWSEIKPEESKANGRDKSQSRAPYDEDSDDDLVEIDPKGGVAIKKDPAQMTPGLAQHTPPLSSRETSAPQTSAARPNGAGSKRSAVIDLTLSDDDEPPRPLKRSAVNSYNTPASPAI
ncbi:putative SUMO ligase SizA [Elsinoe ampelina]|uniref:Putative SUMO ligase SizA n=1 Tax=Elsinoe ampelina TaxID=302913 RepID=A0A6A6GLY4_9PEZI|nr:putative SUMO ligase SizA [Elsinoe ampelina]